MWICPVCGNVNRDALLCERCGFDESLHYKKYRTLEAVEGSGEDVYGPRGNIPAAFQGESFDVFLCCQETDESGERTPDSILAEELYRQLTKEGFRVCLPWITLEGISGVSYVSGLSAALESAGAMVVLGMRPEHFHAAYVQNQWSRYLDLIKKDSEKNLIPAYRDMNSEDLPEELSCLQALDMSGLGFMPDLFRELRKAARTGATENVHPAPEEDLPKSGKGSGAEATVGKPAEKPEVVRENRQERPKEAWEKRTEKPEDPREERTEKPEETRTQERTEETGRPAGKKRSGRANLAAMAVLAAGICLAAGSIFLSRNTRQSEPETEAATAEAEDAETANEGNQDDFLYTVLEDGTIEITGYRGEENGDLIIPDRIDGVPVTSIGDSAFVDCGGFSGSLTLPEGLTHIGFSAFNGCNGLSGSLILPEGLKEIENSAFERCSGLSGSLTLPESLTNIGASAFCGCSGLSGDLALPEGLTEIWVYTFAYCDGLNGSLMLPEGLTTIGDYAFAYCSGLSGSLTLPDSLTWLGKQAFADCRNLSGGLTLPKGLTYLGNRAFLGCSGLSGSLTLPESLTEIGEEVFGGCDGLDIQRETDSPEEAAESRQEALQKAEVGDTISFGSYEQDNDAENGKEEIEWKVLDRQDDSILVISRYCLDCRAYHENNEDVTWENCTLREWLNTSFINEAFSGEEQARLLETIVRNSEDPRWGDGGNDTTDKVFLLNEPEIKQYFASTEERQAPLTEYAKGRNGGYWWLRSTYKNGAACVSSDGILGTAWHVDYDDVAVRPVMWISLEA